MNMHAGAQSHFAPVKETAERLIPEFRRHSAKAVEIRRVPQESFDLLKSSGLLQVLQPASHGGRQLNMRAHVDAMIGVGKGCGATAWALGVYHAHSWMMGHMSEQARDDVYGADPNAAISAVIGPRGKAVRKADGTYTLTGFWPFASGNAHAHWLLLGCQVFDESGTKLDEGDLLVPIKDVTVLDDWHVAGLQGSGSNSVKCADVIVPAHRFMSLPAVIENQAPAYNDPNGPALYKSQAGPVLGLCIASSAPGVARGALAEFVKVVPNKMVMYTNHVSHEWSPLLKALGEAAGLIHAAELVLYKAADDIDDYAARGEKMSMELRGRIRFDIAMAVRFCRDAVEKLYTIGGASGLSLKSPIQRAARDLQATNMHGLLLLDAAAEIYGRILLGVDPASVVL